MHPVISSQRLLLTTVTAAGIALAGCGGSSSSGGLSRAQLASKANAACTSYNTAANSIPQPSDFTTNPVAAAAYLDKLKALAGSTFVTITGLHPASSVKPDFVHYIAAERRSIGYLTAADARAHAKNPAGLKDLAAAAKYKRTTIVPLATRLGFTACIK
ncbi:MAG: hypothetical protein M3071_22235 [Actinomycetota bacterium]|nr:hypothetical protein [Actinomycetota bacterium]